jgi:hypothetical protein
MVKSPVVFFLLTASCGLANALSLLLVLSPSYARSGLLGRIFIRMLVLPFATELFQAGVRALCLHWFRIALPTDVSVALLLPVTMLSAMVGRFYTTSVESTAVPIGFAVAVSCVEGVMRFSVPMCDRLYDRIGLYVASCLPVCLTSPFAFVGSARRRSKSPSGSLRGARYFNQRLSPSSRVGG